MINTATPSYWLTWKFLILVSGLLVGVGAAILLIRKFEGSPRSESHKRDNKEKGRGFLYKDEAWSTCHRAVHPAWLLAYRLIAFTVLLSILVADLVVDGTDMFFFYTQWTFTLVTIYFGLGSSLSIFGCIEYRKSGKVGPSDAESNIAPTVSEKSKGIASNVREAAGSLGYAFQIIFQICAGAVVLTDGVYWLLIYPVFRDKDVPLPVMDICLHSVNAICLFGDVILNSLRFPFFRFAYFILWTSTFVAFQWFVHMCVSTWWPYPFLDISFEYAPFIYLGVGLFHLPCYGLFAFVIKVKYWLSLLIKWAIRALSGDRGDFKHDQEVKN